MSVYVPVPWGSTGTPLEVSTLPYRKTYNGPEVVYSSAIGLRYGIKTRIPGPYQAISGGWRFATPYSTRVIDVRRTPGSRWPASIDNWIDYPASTLDLDVLSLSNGVIQGALDRLSGRADTGALAKLNNSHIEAGVALLEARKTVGHLASVAVRLFTLLRYMRGGRFGDAADLLGLKLSKRGTRALASNWLEYQYAWRPLVMDVSAAYDIAQQKVSQPLTVKAVRDVKDSVSVGLRTWEPYQYNATTLRGRLVTRQHEARIGVKVTLHARISNPAIAGLKAFGLANPAAIAWELMPWSFLIDWVLPVGEFLNACTARLGLSFLDGSQSRYLTLEAAMDDWGGSGAHSLPTGKPYNSGSRHINANLSSRTVYGAFPRPVLYGRTYLSSEKLVTAAALWRVLRTRK